MSIIYLDNNATTKIDLRVMQAMLPYYNEYYSNASNIVHKGGEQAHLAIEDSKESLADFFNVTDINSFIFTSGATESNNLAIRGVVESSRKKKKHIIASCIEHDSVLSVCDYFQKRGVSVTYIPVNKDGYVSPEIIEQSICEDTVLISVMAANNEIGTIQPIERIANIANKYSIPYHCDATQLISTKKIDLKKIGIDLLTFSAHKIYGPKGVGCLYVNTDTCQITPQILGGHQQFNLRSGTYNTPGIVGMAEAIRILNEESEDDAKRICQYRDELLHRLSTSLSLIINGGLKERIPSNLNISLPGIPAMALSSLIPNVFFSFGSACSAGSGKESHVLKAIGLSSDLIKCTIRLSLGRFTKIEEIEQAASMIVSAGNRIMKNGEKSCT